MKKLFVIILMMVSLKGLQAEEVMPCCAPPFISNVVKPNILIVLDVTGSMRWRAAWDGSYSRDQWWNWYCDPPYDPNTTYYGYFHPDSVYRYGAGNEWHAVGYDPSRTTFDMSNTAHPRISGNILNWGVMSRIDVAKKVLTGGKGTPGSLYNKNTLIGEGEGGRGSWAGWRTWPIQGNDGKWYCFDKPSYQWWTYDFNRVRIFYIYRFNSSTHQWDSVDKYNCWIDVRNVPDNLKGGVIAQIADKDGDGYWDPEAPRFGLLIFSTWQFDLKFELYQSEDDPDMEPLFNEINNIKAIGGTNVGNAILEAIHYIRYCPSRYGTYIWHGYGTKWDPFMNFRGNVVTDTVWCRKNFVVMIGDGESNSDDRVKLDPHLPSIRRNLCNYFDYPDEPGSRWDCQDQGWGFDTDDPADDYAYYAHITDLRPDIPGAPDSLPCPQTIDFYAIFAFGQGAQLFKDLAALGGFEDKNGDSLPTGYYTSGPIPTDPFDEWDKDDNGIPDNYYEAQSGQELEDAIRDILTKIIAGVTSASQASIVAQTSKGEGVGTFALFYPKKYVGGGRFLSWLGEIKGVWVDKFGLLREETEGNLYLDLQNDYVINFESPDSTDICNPQYTVYVYRYRDTSCTGRDLEYVDQITLEQITPLWDGGKFLHNMNPDARTILAGIDMDNDGSIEYGEWLPFTTANRNHFLPYLDVYSAGFADTLINYIRGYDYPNLRDRTLNGKVWKLGDIIYSSPMFVQAPMERYDLLYLDADYKDFYETYQDRRGVVYVGANDGMVHAFNVGRYIEDETDPCKPGHVDPLGLPIGKEMWAYIPFNLLPHLKWLTDPDYCHVYYVDLKPYPTDAKIFTPDPIHIGGFGTLLIGSARLGGTPYDVNGRVLSSSYFCIDVTKPEDPVLLWERILPDTSYTVPYPNVIKVGNTSDDWYLVVGSGPQLCSGFSNKKAKIYVLRLKDGTVVKEFEVSENNSAIGDIISVDIGLDYVVDVIYFGTYYYTGSQNNPNWQGRIYRIKTHADPNPNNWDLELVMDVGKPITAAGAATVDNYGNLWIYFGSGRLFYDGDEEDTETQVFIGIKDDTVSTYTYADLIDVTDVQVYGDSVVMGGSAISWGKLVDTIESADGWYRRFTDVGERCLSRPLVIGGAVIFTTYNPEGSGICEFGGQGKLYALYYLTGTAYYKPILGETTSGERIPSVEIGGGVPSEPTMWIGASEEKVFIQIGGRLQDVSPVLPLNPRGGLIMWKGR